MCERGDTQTVDLFGGGRADVDTCIAPLVQALNDNGYSTVASCCGHGIRPGNIALRDGRELIIAPDFVTARKIDQMFPPLAR